MSKRLLQLALVLCVLAVAGCAGPLQPVETPPQSDTSESGIYPTTPSSLPESQVEPAETDPAEEAADPEATTVSEAPLDVSSLEAETSLSNGQIEASGGVAAFFVVEPLSDELFSSMQGKTWREGCPVGRDELRLIRVLHCDAEGQTKVGLMVVNRSIAEELLEIFFELYEAHYPIERMRLVDDYDGDDELSMEDNNTSSFNFRIIAGTSQPSWHSYGLAIDINTFYNPFVVPSLDLIEPYGSELYVDRSVESPYRIERGDLCYELFTSHGFNWGGDWSSRKDYQHFERPLW